MATAVTGIVAAGCAGVAAAAGGASLGTDHSCYQLGHRVTVTGTGFLSSAEYDLDVDGVDFGQALTNSTGGFAVPFAPGGLAAGQAQIVDQVQASDGSSVAAATFTVTRPTGALIGTGSGSSPQRAVPFEVWDFGPGRQVYLHYVLPHRLVRTVLLGQSSGQCGYLRTSRDFFPFKPAAGAWIFQFDTSKAYVANPSRAVRLAVTVG